jgi:hypothetical protein
VRKSLVVVVLTIALFAGAMNAFGHGAKAAMLKGTDGPARSR